MTISLAEVSPWPAAYLIATDKRGYPHSVFSSPEPKAQGEVL